MLMKISLFKMFLVFLKIGALLLGGGYVIVPLLNSELVEKNNWITKEDVVDFYAMGQCVPGIIAVNTTLFIGYKLRGKTGALTAFFGLILPPFLAIIFLASILMKFSDNVIMNDIFWGVNIAIVILMFLTVKEVWNTSIVDKFTLFLFSFILILSVVGVSPSISIVLAGILGIIYNLIKKTKEDKA